mgnify:CR=1 FL=1|tara:strand:- start:80190 stop:80531 length:342 start_codon:yes stop_codon:yes gene_type:complete
MKPSFPQIVESEIIDDNVQLTLVELCQVCQSSEEVVKSWVIEGVFEGICEGAYEPITQTQQHWQFRGPAVQRARLAQTLAQELEINSPGIALALDLMDRIHQLEAQLKRTSRY